LAAVMPTWRRRAAFRRRVDETTADVGWCGDLVVRGHWAGGDVRRN